MQDYVLYSIIWLVVLSHDLYLWSSHKFMHFPASSQMLFIGSFVSFSFFIFAYCLFYERPVIDDLMPKENIVERADMLSYFIAALLLFLFQRINLSFIALSWMFQICKSEMRFLKQYYILFLSIFFGLSVLSAIVIAINPAQLYVQDALRGLAWGSAGLQTLSAVHVFYLLFFVVPNEPF